MADDADFATTNAIRDMERFQSHNFDIESSTHCQECGEEIPERRRIVGNIHFCVGCQSIIESNDKHIFRR